MSIPHEFMFSQVDFTGRVRLFPLPNLVLFPNVLRPLHIFEPRYCEMLENAVAGDRLIAMAVLAPGWESDYEGRPPLCATACLGGVTTHQKLEDGTYNLLLHGLKRVRLLRELPPHHLYREAEVELLEDQYPGLTAGQRPRLRKQLVDHFKALLRPAGTQDMPLGMVQATASGVTAQQLDEMLDVQLPLGVLTDVVAYALDLDLSLKRRLLDECDVDKRAALLIDHFAQQREAKTPSDKFPPDFSSN